MPASARQFIEQIHASGRRFVIALTGGGSQAVADLLVVPGGSRSILEAVVPYSTAAIDAWLGGAPDQYCSNRTARAMAMAAFQRARQLAPDDDPHILVGIGGTASLASDRPKRGSHRIHVAWQTSRKTGIDSLDLTKGARNRTGEEQIATAMVLYALSEAIDVGEEDDSYRQLFGELIGKEIDRVDIVRGKPEWTELLLGNRNVVFSKCDVPDGLHPRQEPSVFFPGAFNPLHAGHRRMAEIAAARTGKPVWFELSIANVDKPPLDFIEIGDRLDQLGDAPVVLTQAALFAEKAILFPAATFVVGADTIERIADPRYYGGKTTERDAAIGMFESNGCRFLVFGRTADGPFLVLHDLNLPTNLHALCDGVPESEFREDISSTELRK